MQSAAPAPSNPSPPPSQTPLPLGLSTHTDCIFRAPLSHRLLGDEQLDVLVAEVEALLHRLHSFMCTCPRTHSLP
jgi:hypothetical protein